jgi:hypothetical protein
MTLDDMMNLIATSSEENAQAFIEAESNAVSRFQMRNLYFKALIALGLSIDDNNNTRLG